MIDTEVQPAPEAGAGNDDVRAIVAAAYEQHANTDTASEPPEPAAAPSEVEAPASERPRNERGQFIKADGTVDTVAEAARVPDADPKTDKPEQVSTPTIEPPKTWSADEKAKWSTLDPAIQTAIARRDAEIDNGGRQWSEQKRSYEESLAPVRTLAQQTGIDEREAIKRLANVELWLRSDPKAALTALAQAYGVTDAPQTGNSQEQPTADPQIAQLTNRVNSLMQDQQARERQAASSEIDAFAKAPGHEHFESVKSRMGELIERGAATDLQSAYEMAVWGNASLREQIMASQTARTAEEQKAKDIEAATRARRAAISVSGSPGGTGSAVPKQEFKTVEEAVRAAWQQHAG